MLTFVLISALAGAALLIVAPRVVPAPFDSVLGIIALAVAYAGPWLLGLDEVAQVVLCGLAAAALALFLRAVHEFVIAATDAKVREIVRELLGVSPPCDGLIRR